MKDRTKVIIIVVALAALSIWVFYELGVEVNAQKDLISTVNTVYEQVCNGEHVSYEQMQEIKKKYERSRNFGGMSGREQDELDRKINVIADACPFIQNDVGALIPWQPPAD